MAQYWYCNNRAEYLYLMIQNINTHEILIIINNEDLLTKEVELLMKKKDEVLDLVEHWKYHFTVMQDLENKTR